MQLQGKPQAQIDPVFADRIRDLQRGCGNQYASVRGEEQRRWQTPPGFSGDLLDPAELHRPAFDRTAMNAQYEAVTRSVEEAGTISDVIGLKLQIDYNAAEERAWRLRHASLVRCLYHSHGRRYGQAFGAPLNSVLEAVAAVIAPSRR